MKNRSQFFFILCGLIILLFPSCSDRKMPEGPLNATASLPPAFQFGQKGYKVITSFFNKKAGSVSMLFGNEKAKQVSMDNNQSPDGAEWALVSWKTMADKHWFGAEIPGELISVEIIDADAEQTATAGMKYTRYSGKDLVMDSTEPPRKERIRNILALRPAILP